MILVLDDESVEEFTDAEYAAIASILGAHFAIHFPDDALVEAS